MRGKHKRENIFDALGLTQALRSFLQSLVQKNQPISVDIVRDFLNDQISALITEENKVRKEGGPVGSPSVVNILESHRVAVPISRNTAYRGMLYCDAEFVKYKHSYYNDVHESKATVEYRTKV
jgi:hypothetical protein